MLYIPIWFYSNNMPRSREWKWNFFTFQSGSIQIRTAQFPRKCVFFFTFQSGSIQMWIEFAFDQIKFCTLHSNLVLFKSKASMILANVSILFTFQSGSIQIKVGICKSYIHTRLYIPIWFYSNGNAAVLCNAQRYFTFQSGSIQIKSAGSKIDG